MEFNRKDLKSMVDMVKPALGNDKHLPQASYLIITECGIAAYNDRIAIHSRKQDLPFELGATDAARLSQWLTKCSSETVTIDCNEDVTEMYVTAGKSKITLAIQEPENFEALDTLLNKFNKLRSIPKGLLEMIDLARVCCTKDKANPSLKCVKVSQDGTVEATDNIRAIVAKTESKTGFNSFLIAEDCAKQLVKFNPTKMQVIEGWAGFQDAAGAMFACRVYEDQFPNLTAVMDSEGTPLELPEEFSKLVQKAQIFAGTGDDSTDEYITVKATKTGITVSAVCDAGDFNESIEFIGNQHELSFDVHPKVLAGIADKTTSCVVGDSVIKFESPNWTCVVCLVV